MFLWFVNNGTMCFLRETHSHLFLHSVCNRWNEMFLDINMGSLMETHGHLFLHLLVIEGMPCSFD